MTDESGYTVKMAIINVGKKDRVFFGKQPILQVILSDLFNSAFLLGLI